MITSASVTQASMSAGGCSVPATCWMTHQLSGVGLAAVAAAASDAPPETAAVLIAAAWLGSLLPDADKAGLCNSTSAPVWSGVTCRRARSERSRGCRCGCWSRCRTAASPIRCSRARWPPPSRAHSSRSSPRNWPPPRPGHRDRIRRARRRGRVHARRLALWVPLSRKRRWLLPAFARIPTGSLRETAAAALFTVLSLGAALMLA